MSDKYCKGNCFDDFLSDYDEDNDNYTVQRLKDIIKICEFLIEREENKKSRKVLDDLLDSAKEEAEKQRNEDKEPVSPYKYRIYPYYIPIRESKRHIPWWDYWYSS